MTVAWIIKFPKLKYDITYEAETLVTMLFLLWVVIVIQSSDPQ